MGQMPVMIPSGNYIVDFYSFSKKSDESRHLIFHIRCDFEVINNGAGGSIVANMDTMMKLMKQFASK